MAPLTLPRNTIMDDEYCGRVLRVCARRNREHGEPDQSIRAKIWVIATLRSAGYAPRRGVHTAGRFNFVEPNFETASRGFWSSAEPAAQ